MNAQRLVRQLRREVKAHPKRAMLLAGLTAVGIYFWAPLIADWVAPDQAAVASAPAKSSSATSAAATASRAATGAAAGETKNSSKQSADGGNAVPWTKLWAAIRDDRRTKPAADLIATPDPFRPLPVPEEPTDGAAESVAQGNNNARPNQPRQDASRAAVSADPTPRSLGMKLTGTIVGSHGRAAVIDGRIVAEGALVAPSATQKAGASSPTVFRVERVEPRVAILCREGKSYKLVIDPPNVNGTDIAKLAPQASD